MEPLRINRQLTIPVDELLLRTLRASGPGGQRVNKVETAVDLRYDILSSRVLSDGQRGRLLEKLAARLIGAGVLQVRASAHREQGRNIELARQRLAEIVSSGLTVPRKRRPTKPTRGSQKRRLEAKKRRSGIKKLRGGGGDDR